MELGSLFTRRFIPFIATIPKKLTVIVLFEITKMTKIPKYADFHQMFDARIFFPP